jgi:hypothetical protein
MDLDQAVNEMYKAMGELARGDPEPTKASPSPRT